MSKVASRAFAWSQCKDKDSADPITVAANAFAASNGNDAISLTKSSFVGVVSITYTTYVGYWVLENGTSDNTSSAVGGEIDAVLTIANNS